MLKVVVSLVISEDYLSVRSLTQQHKLISVLLASGRVLPYILCSDVDLDQS